MNPIPCPRCKPGEGWLQVSRDYVDAVFCNQCGWYYRVKADSTSKAKLISLTHSDGRIGPVWRK